MILSNGHGGRVDWDTLRAKTSPVHLIAYTMKTQGEIEAICEGITRFEQDYMGRGPKHISVSVLMRRRGLCFHAGWISLFPRNEEEV